MPPPKTNRATTSTRDWAEFHTSARLAAAQDNMAVNFRSDQAVLTHPEAEHNLIVIPKGLQPTLGCGDRHLTAIRSVN